MFRLACSDGQLSIRRMEDNEQDYGLMEGWLTDQRVLEYFYGRDNPYDAAKVKSKYGPRVRGEDRVVPCFILWNEKPIGYIQYCPLVRSDYAELALPDIAGAFGTDVFIGEPDYWERGIGTRAVAGMVQYLFRSLGAVRVTIDPRVDNLRAIRCYEKAGFKKVKILPKHELHEGEYRDGWLMVVEADGNAATMKDGNADWFDHLKNTLETAYLQHSEPWRQSGFSGPEEYWVAARKPIADCMEDPGPFLDIGCANGYLLECILRWTAERGLAVTPYGLDLSEKLLRLAKVRLPEYHSNFYVGNAWDWANPIRFRYVHTELVYVPPELQRDYVQRILASYLTDDGILLVTEYRSRTTMGYLNPVDQVLREWGFSVKRVVSGFWEGKEVTRVAVVQK